MTELLLTDRQRAILELVESRGFVTIEGLAEIFSVSAQTVRRDIIALDAAGLLQRFHGGAGSNGDSQPLRLDHERKLTLAVEAKEQIAHKAAAAIPDNASLFLDVGTTLEAAAQALNARSGLIVFTNSIRVAGAFHPARHQVRVLGGAIAGKDGSIVGEDTVLALRALRLDYALIGCSGIEPGGAVMDFDLRKIAVKQTAMTIARQSFLLAASHKHGRTARAEIAHRDRFDRVISEDGDSD